MHTYFFVSYLHLMKHRNAKRVSNIISIIRFSFVIYISYVPGVAAKLSKLCKFKIVHLFDYALKRSILEMIEDTLLEFSEVSIKLMESTLSNTNVL